MTFVSLAGRKLPICLSQCQLVQTYLHFGQNQTRLLDKHRLLLTFHGFVGTEVNFHP